jgi:hypothetical protein
MNYQYQSSAAGYSADAWSKLIMSLVERDIALSNMNTTSNDAQLKMGKASSDSAYASGVADTEAMRKAAWAGIGGSALSMLTAGISIGGQLHQSNQVGKTPQDSKVNFKKKDELIELEEFVSAGPPREEVAATLTGSIEGGNKGNGVGTQEGDTKKKPKLTPDQEKAQFNQKMWSDFGAHYPGSISKIVESGGNISASGEKMKKASADRDQTLEQTIKSMMEAQSRVIDSAIQGNATATNNAISTIQALIAANRAG